jgi:hypothetical protein
VPVHYQIDGGRLIRTRCVGEVTFSEILDHFRLLERDPGRPDHLDVLLDLGALESLPLPGQLRRVSHEIEQIQPTVRFGACAIVATKDIVFGLARMFVVFAEGRFRVMQVFRDAENAEAWLEAQRSPLPEDPEHS